VVWGEKGLREFPTACDAKTDAIVWILMAPMAYVLGIWFLELELLGDYRTFKR
jgi:hypothetical protein